MTLRQYQQDDKQAIYTSWETNNSVLYQLPTGGGKSVVISSILDDHKDENIIVFAHKKKLLSQLKQHIENKGMKCGLLQGQNQSDLDANIIVVSIRTAVKDERLKVLLERNLDKVIIDEARHSRTKSYDKVLKAIRQHNPNYKLLGVDATPYRKDKKSLNKHFDDLVISKEDIQSLTQKGFLQKVKTIVSPIDIESLNEQVIKTTGDYQIQSLSNYMRKDKYLQYIVSQYIQFGQERKAIVFAVDIQHSKDLQVMFEDNGYDGRVARIDSTLSDKEIDNIYDNYTNGDLQIIINVEMITEGVDLPIAGCIIGARPTQSLTLYMQMVGRGGRPDDENDQFILLDCCGWTEEFGTISLPRQWSLDGEKNPNSRKDSIKIIGRRSNGEIEEDLTDYIGEIEEIDIEEYLSQLKDGQEKAEDNNKSIDEKIEESLFTIMLLFKGIDFSGFTYETDGSISSTTENFTIEIKNNDNNNRMSVTLHIDTYKQIIYCKVNGEMWGGPDAKSIDAYYNIHKINGLMNGKLMESQSLRSKIFDIVDQAKSLSRKKINLRALKNKQEELKEEQFKDQLIKHIEKTGAVMFEKNLHWDDYFRDYQSGHIVGIEFPDRKINNHQNTILLRMTMTIKYGRKEEMQEGSYSYKLEKKYIKGDKIMDIIKRGKVIF